jgi:hypothetical protein
MKEVIKVAHLGLGRTHRLNLRFHILAGAVFGGLLCPITSLVNQDWIAMLSFPVRRNSHPPDKGTRIKRVFSCGNFHLLASLTSRNISNTIPALQYPIPNTSQAFFQKPYSIQTLRKTMNKLVPFLGIAMSAASLAPT